MEKKISIYHQLSAIYNELVLMDEDSINEVVEMLKGINFEAIVKFFNESNKEDLDDMDLFTCKKLIEILQFIYNNTDINILKNTFVYIWKIENIEITTYILPIMLEINILNFLILFFVIIPVANNII